MLTRLVIRNFKVFDEVEIELGDRVVLIGPNNSGKTSALQALALWEVGVKRWLEKRGGEPTARKRSGVAISRQDIVALPMPSAKFLWRELHVRELDRSAAGLRTQNVRMEIAVEGVSETPWVCALEFDYANDESIYCRPPIGPDGARMPVPPRLADLSVAYLPPMSGLVAREDRLERGSIRVRLGEGRTAEVLRNLCWQVLTGEDGERRWSEISGLLESLFGSRLDKPQYIAERGEIVLTYRTRSGCQLDISCAGRGEQQTLLLLGHMAANPGGRPASRRAGRSSRDPASTADL